jgi:hypothetical protein
VRLDGGTQELSSSYLTFIRQDQKQPSDAYGEPEVAFWLSEIRIVEANSCQTLAAEIFCQQSINGRNEY